ncbi:choice-of-anchor Q domain-containing protein [Neolewinella antarctica]|uniref:Secretion system C-terminal sorting domain-containing protein n=1 Tax=Neolewinella antarctica TaxID=442734 RepID=A0ABX0XFX7_9BACT|nr:choice-of-anchor Q domain-containing protein [Neolewinella antarctica]NJC28040.1 hypothetical protein [Neolewinella antarctica]
MKHFFSIVLLFAYCSGINAQTLANTTWINYFPDGSSLYFHFTLDTLSFSGDGVDYVNVSFYEEDADTLTLRDVIPDFCDNLQIGTYTFSTVNDTADFTLVTDSCLARAFAFDQGVFVKAPGPVTYVKPVTIANNTWKVYRPNGTITYYRFSSDTTSRSSDGVNFEKFSAFKENGDTLIVQDFPPGFCDPSQVGSYTFSIVNDTASFIRLSDICRGRMGAFLGATWVRVPPTGTNDGSSWDKAYTTLHEALENYDAGDEIWVAAGTYLPEIPSSYPDSTRRIFYLHQNASIYGGFNGTETTRDQRDPAANVTVLSGDVNGDDVAGDLDSNRTDNVNNVMAVDTLSTFSVLDGFTVSGGHADEDFPAEISIAGSGIFSTGVLHLNNCTIESNYSLSNNAVNFSEIATAGSSVRNCLFQNNKAGYVIGALGFGFTKDIIIDGCQFIDNEATDAGGALGFFAVSASVRNCLFRGNSSTFDGGAFIAGNFGLRDLEISVTNCAFEENSSTNGGAVHLKLIDGGDNNYHFSNCTFRNNTAVASPNGPSPDGGAMAFAYTAGNPSNDTIMLRDCLLENNTADHNGGGIAYTNSLGTNNYLEVNNSQFVGNTSGGAGGGLFMESTGATEVKVNLTGSVFDDNSSADGAGAVQLYKIGTSTSDSVKVENCLLANNSGGNPGGGKTAAGNFTGGIGMDGAINLSVKSTTIADNDDGGISTAGGNLDIQNTILYNPNSPDFVSASTSTASSLGGNLIGDDTMDDLLTSTDQSSTDPLFEVATFLLSVNSPAVDAGFVTGETPEFDLAGNARIQGGCLDIGAYESPFNAGEGCVTAVREVIVSASALKAFPNPASAQLQLSIANDWRGTLSIQVVNALGQVVHATVAEKHGADFQQRMNIAELPVGTYRLVVSDGAEMMVRAFAKQ